MGLLDMFIEIKPSEQKPAKQTELPVQNSIPENYYNNTTTAPNILGAVKQPSANDASIIEKISFFRKLLNELNLPGPDIKEDSEFHSVLKHIKSNL